MHTDCEKKKTAIFLDQGGTLINDNKKTLQTSIYDLFFPGVIDALRILQRKHLLFIVTNQSAVGLGKISREEAEMFNNELLQTFNNSGIRIEQIFSCMHKREDRCKCIKPNPYFLYKAQDMFNIDLQKSYVIGDHPHDIEFAANAGATGIYVLTGHGIKHCNELPAAVDVPVFSNIIDAASWIDNRH